MMDMCILEPFRFLFVAAMPTEDSWEVSRRAGICRNREGSHPFIRAPYIEEAKAGAQVLAEWMGTLWRCAAETSLECPFIRSWMQTTGSMNCFKDCAGMEPIIWKN